MKSKNHLFDPDLVLQKAFLFHQSGKLQEAENLYRSIIKQSPSHAMALTLLGTLLIQKKQFSESAELLRKSIKFDPNQSLTYQNLGVALYELGKYEASLLNYDRAIKLNPNYPDTHNNRANTLRKLSRLDEALEGYDAAIFLFPDFAEAYSNRGITLNILKRYDYALASFDRAIFLKPDFAEAYYHKGNVLQDLQRLEEALESYNRAVSLKPDYAEAYFNQGNVLQDLQMFDQALVSYDRAIALKPDYAEAYNSRGNALHNLKMFDQALASYDWAIALNPDYADPFSNRGLVLQYFERLGKALASCDRAIEINVDHAEAHNNRGNVLQKLKRFDEALISYDRAIALKPDYALAYWNKALLKILTGEYGEGWQLYEWRWKCIRKGFVRNFSQPLWLGQLSVAGKTLLVDAEQGLGDTIQFCRYAPLLEAIGARVVLEVPASLVTLISTLKGNFTVVEKGKPLPAFDLHCPIMSLPLAFKTTIATIPAPVQYLLADKDKQKIWQKRLGNKTKPRVGLFWSGSTTHNNDHNRSIPLQLLEPLLQLPMEFHSLQKEIRPDDAAILSNFKQIRSHQEQLHDFSDTAALVQAMDLVITVDTSVAHLAGALGQSFWLLLPFVPDYRWMLDRTDSPWYPTATLFRQTAIYDWTSVITQVVMRLNAL